MRRNVAMIFTLAVVFILACSAGEPTAAQPDAGTVCAFCRMSVSDLRFAAQLVAPGEEPRFFDDIGCMRKYLAAHRDDAKWTAFVSDYRSRRWIAGATAHYWTCSGIDTPMSSHVVATGADAAPAEGCTSLKTSEIYGEGKK